MCPRYSIENPSGIYFLTFTTVSWVDVFTRPAYKKIIIESLKFCQQNKGLMIYAWCIMTNHLHIIAAAEFGFNLSDIIRDFKKYTSKKLIKALCSNRESRRNWMLKIFKNAGRKNSNNKFYQLWQQHNHPIELYSNFIMDQKLDYLHFNPVVEGIVYQPQHYPYSSAIDYWGGKGLIEVKFIQ